ncbi:MAG TPA: hypothetical protein VMT99_03010 [Candidatus Paceibacterota bacterium]|nr:hypothetical protein [Candidatus Paceibacterota bacterium]
MTNDIVERLQEVVAAGDEAAAREFVMQHLHEFSDEDRRAIIVSLATEALSRDAEEIDGLLSLQENGVKTVHALEKIQEKIDDKRRLLDIKESI